jgi:Aldo/keto reductase family
MVAKEQKFRAAHTAILRGRRHSCRVTEYSFFDKLPIWLLHRSPVILPIPGTSSVGHLEENLKAAKISFSEAELKEIEISIFAGDPVTDIVLASAVFASLVKELVFMGAARRPNQPDFNFRFDPEAAWIDDE